MTPETNWTKPSWTLTAGDECLPCNVQVKAKREAERRRGRGRRLDGYTAGWLGWWREIRAMHWFLQQSLTGFRSRIHKGNWHDLHVGVCVNFISFLSKFVYLCLYKTDTNDVYVENAVVRDIRLNAIMVNAASLASIYIGRLAGQERAITSVLNW